MRDEEIEALKTFAIKAFEVCFEGNDWNGGDIQDTAVQLGLLIETKFVREVHDPHDFADAEPGDPWYELAPFLKHGNEMAQELPQQTSPAVNETGDK